MQRTPSAHDACRADRPARSLRRARGERGFTLIEVLITAVILIVGIMSLFGLLDATAHSASRTHFREGATNLARAIIEEAHTIPYAQMSTSGIESELQQLSGLADASSATGWQIKRNGVTYTVTASECAIDDPKDGVGFHEAGVTFCADSAPGAKEAKEATDSQPIDLKQVTVTVAWQDLTRKAQPSISQVATFTAAGSAVGLNASSLQLILPEYSKKTAPLITSEPSNGELKFEVQAPTGTGRVDWSVNGVRQSTPATHGSGTAYTFFWKIAGLSDGSYQIGAQAVNEEGVVGPPVSITVTLIRNVPAAPKSIVGGFDTVLSGGKSTRIVELEWQSNSELNILGYRVYRPLQPSGRELACPSSSAALSLTTTCSDFSPPGTTATNLTYEVVALYRKWEPSSEPLNAKLSEAVYEGSAGTLKVGTAEAPHPPTSLKAVRNSDGTVTLTWVAPATGPEVSFYRIYRGSKEYSSRLGTTGSGTTVTFTDETTKLAHQYWVTAVGTSFAESEFLGPVEA